MWLLQLINKRRNSCDVELNEAGTSNYKASSLRVKNDLRGSDKVLSASLKALYDPTVYDGLEKFPETISQPEYLIHLPVSVSPLLSFPSRPSYIIPLIQLKAF